MDTQYFRINGCPDAWATCTWNDIFLLCNIEGISCIFNLIFTLCLMYEFKKWPGMSLQRRIALVQLLMFQITFLFHEVGTWAWLIQWTKVHPWYNWILMVLGLHHSLMTSIISIKASRMADVLRGARSLRKVKGIGLMNKISVFISIIDPVLVVIYSMIYTGDRMYEGWGVISFQNIFVNVINNIILIAIIVLIKVNNVPGGTVRAILIELIVLQMCSWLVTCLEYAITITGAFIPLYVWYIAYGLEHVAAFFFRYFHRKALKMTKLYTATCATNATGTKMSAVMTSSHAVKTGYTGAPSNDSQTNINSKSGSHGSRVIIMNEG